MPQPVFDLMPHLDTPPTNALLTDESMDALRFNANCVTRAAGVDPDSLGGRMIRAALQNAASTGALAGVSAAQQIQQDRRASMAEAFWQAVLAYEG